MILGTEMSDSKPTMQTLLEAIVRMMQEGRWVDALASWENFSTRYSDNTATYLSVARELRDLRQSEQAESIFCRMLDRFPANLKPALDYAMMAYSRHDWREAIRRFKLGRSRFPDTLDGHRFVADLLLGQKQFEEADSVLREALLR